jgi:hypothetical protein
MRHLHTIAPLTQLFWYGSNYPCTNPYHNGYDSERVMTDTHEPCMDMIRVLDTQAIRCRCACRTIVATHYVSIPVAQWLALNNDFICDPCLSGVCPTPPPHTRTGDLT